jgi:hypothetical protein
MQLYFAIYKVWEQKCKCVLLFTECGSENANVFCYLQSVGAKIRSSFRSTFRIIAGISMIQVIIICTLRVLFKMHP